MDKYLTPACTPRYCIPLIAFMSSSRGRWPVVPEVAWVGREGSWGEGRGSAGRWEVKCALAGENGRYSTPSPHNEKWQGGSKST